MSNPLLYCFDCFVFLSKTNIKAARLWNDLCEAHRRYGIFGLVTSDTTPSLIFLERMGFIITTDTRDLIVVKVCGQQDDQDGFFFCGGRCDE